MADPKENIKNPIVVWILSIVCFILMLIHAMRWSKEINEFKKGGEQVPNGILVIIPIYGILVMYKIFVGVKELQAENGIPEDEQLNPVVTLILCCVVGLGVMQAQTALNKVWERMTGGAPAAAPAAAAAPPAEAPAAAPPAAPAQQAAPPPPPPPPAD